MAAEEDPSMAPAYGEQLLPVEAGRYHNHRLSWQIANRQLQSLNGDFGQYQGFRLSWRGGVDLARDQWLLQGRSRLLWAKDGALGPGHSDEAVRLLIRMRALWHDRQQSGLGNVPVAADNIAGIAGLIDWGERSPMSLSYRRHQPVAL